MITTAAGDVYESEFDQMVSTTPGFEDVLKSSDAPLKITVHPASAKEEQPAQEAKPPVSVTDVLNSLGSDMKKFFTSLADIPANAKSLVEDEMTRPLGMPLSETPETADKAIQSSIDVGLLSSPVPKPTSSLGMFGGRLGSAQGAERAKFYSLGKTDIIRDAKDRLLQGEDPLVVARDTGVHEGPDGKLRFEFSDADARLKTENLERGEIHTNWFHKDANGVPATEMHYKTPYPRYTKRTGKEPPSLTGPATVGDILDHPTLFKHYPELKDIKLERGPWFAFDIHGWHNQERNAIFLKGQGAEDMKSVLLHELQHAIQRKEGHAYGGNTDQFIPKPELFEEVSTKATELDKALTERFDANIKEDINKEIGEAWKKATWSTGIHFSDLKNALSQYHRGKEFTPAQKQLVEFVYDKDKELLKDTVTQIEARHLVDKIEKEAFQRYEELYGEYEARTVQQRRYWDDRERRLNPHWESDEFKRVYPGGKIPEEAINLSD